MRENEGFHEVGNVISFNSQPEAPAGSPNATAETQLCTPLCINNSLTDDLLLSVLSQCASPHAYPACLLPGTKTSPALQFIWFRNTLTLVCKRWSLLLTTAHQSADCSTVHVNVEIEARQQQHVTQQQQRQQQVQFTEPITRLSFDARQTAPSSNSSAILSPARHGTRTNDSYHTASPSFLLSRSLPVTTPDYLHQFGQSSSTAAPVIPTTTPLARKSIPPTFSNNVEPFHSPKRMHSTLHAAAVHQWVRRYSHLTHVLVMDFTCPQHDFTAVSLSRLFSLLKLRLTVLHLRGVLGTGEEEEGVECVTVLKALKVGNAEIQVPTSVQTQR